MEEKEGKMKRRERVSVEGRNEREEEDDEEEEGGRVIRAVS